MDPNRRLVVHRRPDHPGAVGQTVARCRTRRVRGRPHRRHRTRRQHRHQPDAGLGRTRPRPPRFRFPVTRSPPPAPADQNPVAISMVGDTAVVLDRPTGRIIVGDRQFSLPQGAVGAVLQQSGPAADGVLVATDRALLRVDLATGDVSTFDPGSTGTPGRSGLARQLRARGLDRRRRRPTCSGAVRCRASGDPVGRRHVGAEVPGEPGRRSCSTTSPRGNTWVLDENMTVVNNWDAVAPPKQEDAESSDDGEETSSNQLTTSRTDCSGGMAPPAAGQRHVRRASRADRRCCGCWTTMQTSNCSMVIVSARWPGCPEIRAPSRSSTAGRRCRSPRPPASPVHCPDHLPGRRRRRAPGFDQCRGHRVCRKSVAAQAEPQVGGHRRGRRYGQLQRRSPTGPRRRATRCS